MYQFGGVSIGADHDPTKTDARCRQIEENVRSSPGSTLGVKRLERTWKANGLEKVRPEMDAVLAAARKCIGNSLAFLGSKRPEKREWNETKVIEGQQEFEESFIKLRARFEALIDGNITSPALPSVPDPRRSSSSQEEAQLLDELEGKLDATLKSLLPIYACFNWQGWYAKGNPIARRQALDDAWTGRNELDVRFSGVQSRFPASLRDAAHTYLAVLTHVVSHYQNAHDASSEQEAETLRA